MTDVLITIDTELSAGLHQQGLSLAQNLARSVEGRVGGEGRAGAGRYGVGWQMDAMEAAGLKGVFFVDPLPALVYGPGFLPDVVGPMLARGHEVQLHVHTEWLAWAPASPVEDRRGRNIGDFALADQVALIRTATDLLEGAGVPRPTAFRAGNFGADARTLEALATLGIAWDSSVDLGRSGGARAVGPGMGGAAAGYAPFRVGRVAEVPVAGLLDRPGHFRPAQVCALSAREMAAALRHAAKGDAPFAVVTHSFEMLSRDRRRPNRTMTDRFRRLCAAVARDPRLRSAGFNDLDAAAVTGTGPGRATGPGEPLLAPDLPRPNLLRPNLLRTAGRMVEQLVSGALYDRSLYERSAA